LRSVLSSGDAYTDTGKPVIDWSDRGEREALVDSRARDGHALLAALDGRDLPAPVAQAAQLLATVLGQDLAVDAGGVFRIARRVAKDRVISTVDPQARHGHKTAARGFDGYQGHVAVDPDSEIITATTVTPGNAGDASVAADLITDLYPEQPPSRPAATSRPAPRNRRGYPATTPTAPGSSRNTSMRPGSIRGARLRPRTRPAAASARTASRSIWVRARSAAPAGSPRRSAPPATAVAPPTSAQPARNVRCAGNAPPPPRAAPSPSDPHEATLARARARQVDPDWILDYRATRPKVERKIGHMMRRKHGGRRARMRGTARIDADFRLLAAAINLARLAVLNVRYTATGWAAPA
jgi:hypothetical protein